MEFSKKISLYAVYKRLILERRTDRQEVRGQKEVFHAKGNEKRAGVVILILDKADFETKAVIKDKEEHYIMTKGSIQQEDITVEMHMHPTDEYQEI